MTKIGYYEGVTPLNNCCSLVLKYLDETPDRTMIYWAPPASIEKWRANPAEPLAHQSFSFKQMFDMVYKIAYGLKQHGIGHGDRVILFMPMTPYLYATLTAVQMVGATAVFLDTWARRQQLGLVAGIVNPKAMISLQAAFDLCAGEALIDNIPCKIALGPVTRDFSARLEEFLGGSNLSNEICPVAREHPALITFTTGSSGMPKGANRTHRFLAAQHYALDTCIPYNETDVDLPVFPVFSLNNIVSGVPTVLPAIDVAKASADDGALLVRQALDCQITCMTLNPSLVKGMSRFCREHNLKLDGLRRVFAGGAAVSRDTVLEFAAVAPRAELLVAYGSTEVEPITHITSAEIMATPSLTEQDPELVDNGVIVGHFCEDLQYKFLRLSREPIAIKADSDWSSWELPAGATGEIIVAGEHVCREYYNDEEAFRRAKIMDPQGVVWHRTGDVGYLDKNGQLWLVGRVHNAIIRDGRYYFPVKAEVILLRMPFVKQAAYLGIADAKLGEKVICVVAPHDTTKIADEACCALWRSQIERLMAKNQVAVDGIVFREHIVMDPRHNSKVEYEVLRASLLKDGVV